MDIRKYSFPHRCVDLWNSMPHSVANAPSVVSFEHRLDKFLINQDIKFDYKAAIHIDTGRSNVTDGSKEDLVEEA